MRVDSHVYVYFVLFLIDLLKCAARVLSISAELEVLVCIIACNASIDGSIVSTHC